MYIAARVSLTYWFMTSHSVCFHALIRSKRTWEELPECSFKILYLRVKNKRSPTLGLDYCVDKIGGERRTVAKRRCISNKNRARREGGIKDVWSHRDAKKNKEDGNKHSWGGRQQTFLRGERKLEVKVTEIKLYLIVIMKGFSWDGRLPSAQLK